MSDEMKKREQEVFAQELSEEELDNIAGGGCGCGQSSADAYWDNRSIDVFE